MRLKKFEGNPIISPEASHPWENLVTCNPGAIWEDGKFYLLYRAAGDDPDHVIRFGLAVSEDGFHFERVGDVPVFGPSEDGYDSGCVEDPRIVKIGENFYVTYAFRPMAPGQYWKFPHDVVLYPDCDEFAPMAWAKNLGGTALAMTKDFKSWRRLGRLTSPMLDDRDVILFPEKIAGKYAMLHRPKQWVGEQWGTEYPAIWIKFSDDLLDWGGKQSRLLLKGRKGSWEEKIGGSTPPLRTEKGWLVLYHGVGEAGLADYSVGAVLLDLENPLKVLARTPEPIMVPEHPFETEGFYNGCVFPVGNVIVGDTLYVYYGGADKYVGVATCKVEELLDYLEENPVK